MWYKKIQIIIACLLCVCAIQAKELSERSRVSLLTCTPGQELYARYGHTALLVADPEQDLELVFNYGIFDFNVDHFYYKFVKGETYYQLGAELYSQFMLEYAYAGREVYEQELNLTRQQRQAVFDALLENFKPENRVYLYNFVFDNCATRPLALIERALGDSIHSTYRGYQGLTYREFISHYTRPSSWEDFGINLLFGCRADRKMEERQNLFLPEEVMNYVAVATLPNGQPLVRKQQVAPFKIDPVPWYETWYLGAVVFFLVMLIITRVDKHRGHISWWVDIVLAVVYLLLVALVIFLTYFSIHPLVGFNWRLLLLPVLHLCARLSYICRS
ncbi:MAG: DUF4105 domain-containing protein [Paludibacteraceae bacterium]|nr:DUF4105 domain-containing protein [Paludibacteraceae bacterium]MBQ2608688.1 DUF4105 domain-containing protein [Paludibacteraceae bacterium]